MRYTLDVEVLNTENLRRAVEEFDEGKDYSEQELLDVYLKSIIFSNIDYDNAGLEVVMLKG